MTEDRLLSRAQVADRLQISKASLNRLRINDPSFPQPIKIGQRPLWRASSLSAWFDAQEAKAQQAA